MALFMPLNDSKVVKRAQTNSVGGRRQEFSQKFNILSICRCYAINNEIYDVLDEVK